MIPDRVKALVGEHIVSVEQLEVLLLLRESADQDWTPAQVNDQIKSSVGSVTERLANLESRGFLRRQADRYQYDRTNPNDAAVAELAVAYSERRFSIIDLIFSKPTDKLRVFARAFKIRGDNG
jgi:DNA-binding MarR family transcriptional regulator